MYNLFHSPLIAENKQQCKANLIPIPRWCESDILDDFTNGNFSPWSTIWRYFIQN